MPRPPHQGHQQTDKTEQDQPRGQKRKTTRTRVTTTTETTERRSPCRMQTRAPTEKDRTDAETSHPHPFFPKSTRCLNAGPRSGPRQFSQLPTAVGTTNASVQSCPFVYGDQGVPIGIPGAGTVGACARCGPKSGDPLTKNLNHRNLGSFDRRGPAIVGHRPEFGKKSTTDTIRPCRDRDHFDRHANTAQYRSPCRADVIIGHKPSLQGRAHGTAGRLATRQKTPLTGQLVAKLGSEKRSGCNSWPSQGIDSHCLIRLPTTGLCGTPRQISISLSTEKIASVATVAR